MSFEFKRTDLQDVFLVIPKVFKDDRGFFMETYEKRTFESAGIHMNLVQSNHSKSTKDVLRGLHFQKEPFSQAKLVRCIRGEILDVAVDVRKNSKTFGKHVKFTLSEDNRNMLYIPRGFAHGFLVLSDTAEVVYDVDNFYSAVNEAGLIWNDKTVGISWGIQNPILSEKDKKWPKLEEL